MTQLNETPKKATYATAETIGIGGENQVMEAALVFNHENGRGHIAVKLTTKMLAYNPQINQGVCDVAARLLFDRMQHFEELRKEWHFKNDGRGEDSIKFPDEKPVSNGREEKDVDPLSYGFTNAEEKDTDEHPVEGDLANEPKTSKRRAAKLVE